MKPLLLCVLIAVALYTYTRKNFGTQVVKHLSRKKRFVYAALISLAIGFYDGFIGPGAGSFLIICFIAILGQDFLLASAHAKFVAHPLVGHVTPSLAHARVCCPRRIFAGWVS